MSEKELLAKKKDELVALCKERNLPHTGTKNVLVGRILGIKVESVPKKRAQSTTATPKSKAELACHKVIGQKYIRAQKNSYGEFEDPVSHLIFEPETKYVIGKREGDQLLKLSVEDVQFCTEKGLHYAPSAFDRSFSSKKQDIEEVIETILKEGGELSEDESEHEE